MKTFILNSINSLRSYSENLDAESTLYSKSWEVFNETGNKELFIFRPNNDLLISQNGIVQKGKWELLNIATLLIDIDSRSYLLNAAYIEDNFLALKLDGTEQYMIMIETDMKDRFSMNTIESIENYLEDRYKMICQERKNKEIAEKERIRQIEQAKRENEEVERLNIIKRLNILEKKLYKLKDSEKKYKLFSAWYKRFIFITLSTLSILIIMILIINLIENRHLVIVRIIENTRGVIICLFILALTTTGVMSGRKDKYKKEYNEYQWLKSDQEELIKKL